jgi:hypothetical protein
LKARDKQNEIAAIPGEGFPLSRRRRLNNGGFFIPIFTRRQSREPGETPETK